MSPYTCENNTFNVLSRTFAMSSEVVALWAKVWLFRKAEVRGKAYLSCKPLRH
jgi:hypothetical protein